MKAGCNGRWIVLAGAILACAGSEVSGQELKASVVKPPANVFVGEPFALRIQVTGSKDPERPELADLDGFKAQFAGGRDTSSFSSVTINGVTTNRSELGYLLEYRVRATRAGTLTIPSIEIKANGKTARTRAVNIRSQQPVETKDFKLRRTLSKTQVYVGEQVPMEIVFYYTDEKPLDQQSGLVLNSPLEEHEDFDLYTLESTRERKKTTLEGMLYNVSRVNRVVVPRRAGKFTIEPATLGFVTLDGYEVVRDRFGRNRRQPKRRRMLVPTRSLELDVLPLPAEGKPANFGGHIGDCRIEVTPSVTEMNVGDPITLDIALRGSAMLDAMELPPLEKQASLTRDFKVPTEIEEGKVSGGAKRFKQTVRVLRDDVTEIPPIELVYFDPVRKSYEVSRSQAIPITVRATKILTAGDAEGLGPVSVAQSEVQALMQGIAHNYSGGKTLSRELLGFSGLVSPGRLVILVGPPLAYSILAAWVVIHRRRHADPASARERRASGLFRRTVTSANGSAEVVGVFTSYLGDKLGLTAEALTYRDVESPLRARGMSEDELAEIRGLFAAGEASRFAGGVGESEVGEIRERAIGVVDQLERRLR